MVVINPNTGSVRVLTADPSIAEWQRQLGRDVRLVTPEQYAAAPHREGGPGVFSPEESAAFNAWWKSNG